MNPEMHPALRVLAVIILVLLLILGAWGIIVIFSWLPGAFGGYHPTQNETATTTPATEHLAVSAPSQIESGTSFTLAWNHQGGVGAYGYTISYSCGAENAVTIDAPLPTGSTKSVPCNTPFNYTNATSQINLTPHLASSAKQGASVQFTVAAVNLSNGTTTASGTAIASVAAAQKSSSSTQNTPSYTVSKGSTKGYSSNPNGIIDLSVQIISLTPTSAQFKIANVGTKTAPYGWIFTAQLPTQNGYSYTSPIQSSIAPGGYIINTLNWTNPTTYQNCSNSYPYNGYQYNYPYNNYPYNDYGYQYNQYSQNCYNNNGYSSYNHTFSVSVDPYSAIPDVNRYNNTVSASI
jgi:hypothetical protein